MKFRFFPSPIFTLAGLMLAIGLTSADVVYVDDSTQVNPALDTSDTTASKSTTTPTDSLTPSTKLVTTPAVRRTKRLRAPLVDGPPREALTIHPISSIMITGFSLGYEFPLKPRLSLEVPVYFGISSRQYDQGRIFAGSGLGMRLYLVHPDYGGYVSPSFEFLDMQFFKDTEQAGGNTLITLAWLRYGYKFLWRHFTLDLGGGFGYGKTFGGSPSGPTDTPISGFIPMGHFALGIPFGGTN